MYISTVNNQATKQLKITFGEIAFFQSLFKLQSWKGVFCNHGCIMFFLDFPS
jgi:hypothetical protein